MMEIQPNIILGLAVVFGVLIILLIGLFATFTYSVQKSINTKKVNGNEGKIDPDELTSEVHAKSLKILEDAHKKARDILSEAEDFLKRDEGRIASQIEKIEKVYLDTYESSLNSIKLEAIKTIHSIPKDINESYSKSLLDFQEELKSEIQKTRQKLISLTSENIKNTENEAEKHKAFRMRQIDESIVDITSEIAKKVISRDISDLEHEKLVLRALEEAKKEGMFEN